MDSVLERIEENTLDALYLFINETLRDRNEFDRFFVSLMNVLPHNWSIQRVEVGHEFLGMVNDQLLLFETVTGLEALKTLIISDGYVPRKDKGSIHTEAFLMALPRARNLINLDLHRLELSDVEQVDMLADALDSMQESLEEIRMTGLFVSSRIPNLDPAIMACVDMGHLRSLAMTCIERSPSLSEQQQQRASSRNNNNNSATNKTLITRKQTTIISCECLLELFQNSSTLQDLSLRAMNVDDETCRTIAKALQNNLFLTSLDLRQNPKIGQEGCRMILEALERNYDLWCTVMVDNESFQGRFNSLIELNQANRGDLIRNPTSEKLVAFLERLKDDPTAVWYFLTIHDTVLYPFINYLRWKSAKEKEGKTTKKRTGASVSSPPPPVAVAAAASSLDYFALPSSSKRSRTAHDDIAATTSIGNNLADQVSAILAQQRQQPSYSEMVAEMDSRAVEEEVQAILAQQRRQNQI